MDPTIPALLREREGYLRRGLPERAAEVDAALARLGHETATAEPQPAALPPQSEPETTSLEAPPETATPPRPRPRRSNP